MEAHLRSELNGLGLYSSLDQHNRYEFSGHAFSFEDWFQHWAESPQTIERCGQFSFTSTPKEFRERLDLLRCALARPGPVQSVCIRDARTFAVAYVPELLKAGARLRGGTRRKDRFRRADSERAGLPQSKQSEAVVRSP